MAGGQQTETVRGRVEQTNEKGLKVDGRWFNFSQYSRSSVRPNEGDEVELEIARGKFINDARVLGAGAGGASGASGDGFGSFGGGAGSFGGGQDSLGLDDDDPFAGSLTSAAPPPPRAAARPSAPLMGSASSGGGASATPNADRNTEIRRLALIKAAADYAAARDMEPDDVVTLASRWEEWVTSGNGGSGQR
jgi:hypothetical protein